MPEPTKPPGGDEFPPTKRLFWNPWSIGITVGSGIILIFVVIFMGVLLNSGEAPGFHFNGSLLAICFFALFFFSLVALIITAVLMKSCKKGPHGGHAQLNASTLGDKPKEMEKKPSPGKAKIWFWRLIKLNIAILILFALYYAGIRLRALNDGSSFITMSSPTQRVISPLVCTNAWQREANKVGNHANESNTDYFDVQPTGNCFEEWIYPPNDWNGWEKEFVSSGDECRVWFWFFGKSKPYGPYAPSNLPEFENMPKKWRVSTNCTIRYFRTH